MNVLLVQVDLSMNPQSADDVTQVISVLLVQSISFQRRNLSRSSMRLDQIIYQKCFQLKEKRLIILLSFPYRLLHSYQLYCWSL